MCRASNPCCREVCRAHAQHCRRICCTEPTTEGGTPDLVTQHLPELNQKLNAFDAARRTAIVLANRLAASVYSSVRGGWFLFGWSPPLWVMVCRARSMPITHGVGSHKDDAHRPRVGSHNFSP